VAKFSTYSGREQVQQLTRIFRTESLVWTKCVMTSVSLSKRGMTSVSLSERGMTSVSLSKRGMTSVSLSKRGMTSVSLSKRGMTSVSLSKRGINYGSRSDFPYHNLITLTESTSPNLHRGRPGHLYRLNTGISI
jgi:hypothetical protein